MFSKCGDPASGEEDRHIARLRAMSKDLPGYQAMTIDFSSTGAQLESTAPVPPGKQLDLSFDIDSHPSERVNCQGEVKWCRAVPLSESFRLGVQFCDNSAEVQAQIAELAHYLEKRTHTQLRDLLEEARMLGPAIAPGLAAAAGAPMPQPTQEAPPPEDRRLSPRFLLLPLQATLCDYRRERPAGLFVTLLGPDGQKQVLHFPDCLYFVDLGFGTNPALRGMRSLRDSQLLAAVVETKDVCPSKHYQLLGDQGLPVLEIVSGPCCLASA